MAKRKQIIDGKKECGSCGSWKPLSNFNKCRYAATGYRSQCAECMSKQRLSLKGYYKKWRDRDSTKAMYREYRKVNYNPKKTKARNLVNRALWPGGWWFLIGARNATP